MKKVYQYLIFLFSILAIAGCAHNGVNHQKKILQRSSFLKVEKALIINSCINESVCTQRKLRSSGSAAVIKTTFSGAYVLTAAHVCDDEDVIARIKLDEPTAKISSTFEVVTLLGEKHSVEILDMDHKNDMCILWVKNLYEPPLLVATQEPDPGDRVYNMAAPLGVFSKNMVPIFTGFFNGNDFRNIAIYSLPAFGGSSGSPIVNVRGELVGMVHSTLRFFPEIALSPNYKDMRTFINNTIEKDAHSRILNVFLNVVFR